MKPQLSKILGYLQLFIGMGAVAGALPMILTPLGSEEALSIELLRNTPFTSYLIPGIVLFSINGVGSLVASYFSLKRLKPAGIMGMVFGIALIIWIIVQLYLMGFASWLQPLYFALGTLELLFGVIIYRRNQSN